VSRPCFGPRFYRVRATRGAESTGSNHDQRRSEAASEVRRLVADGYTVTLETVDDRYPANVLHVETFEP
jgi:ribulose bisphosphate carboxylase small subunit